MSAISVPPGFVADFALVIERAGITPRDADAMRVAIRKDFERQGGWITDTAKLYRFCDATWHGVPTVDLCRGYMAACRHWPDERVFKTWGILLLARECMRLSINYLSDTSQPTHASE